MSNETQTEISDLKQSVALLTELLARGAQRAELEHTGEQNKSPALLAHERRQAKLAAALRPRVEIPPENPEGYITIQLGRPADPRKRDPEYHQVFSGIELHDPEADQYVSFGLAVDIPCFVEARFWQGSFPFKQLDNLMRKGIVTVTPGVVVDDPIVATQWGEAVAIAYEHGGQQKNRVSEDELLRVARMVDDAGCGELARNMRHLAGGKKFDPNLFGLIGSPDFDLE